MPTKPTTAAGRRRKEPDALTCHWCRKAIAGADQLRLAVRLAQGLTHRSCYEQIRRDTDAAFERAIAEGRFPRIP